MKILVLNGPNINMLGKREPEIYGGRGYDALCDDIQAYAKSINAAIDIMQSNIEGELVSALQEADGVYDGVVMNPAAYTHYSVALLDAIYAISIPVVEVHISNIHAREEFRKNTVTTPACIGQICGFGFDSYILGIEALKRHLNQ